MVNTKKKTEQEHLEIIEDFCQHFCIVCKKRIQVLCGTPVVRVFGCCSGVLDDELETQFVRPVHSHMHCYLQYAEKYDKPPKTRFKYKEIERVIKRDRTTKKSKKRA